MENIGQAQIEQSIAAALAENVGRGDVTTEAIIAVGAVHTGRFVAKANGIIAGLEIARQVFTKWDDLVSEIE